MKLMFVLRTPDRQHILLTRFEPLAPGAADLDDVIRTLLAEVDTVLPGAVEGLRKLS